MENKGHQIVIAAPKGTPLFKKAKKHGFNVYDISFNRRSILRDYDRLTRVFRNEQPDVVNTHGNEDAKLSLYAAKKMKVPLRILSRHISAHVRNSWYSRKLYKKYCHYVFTTSDYTTKHLKQIFKLNDMQVFTIPSGIAAPEKTLEKSEAVAQLCQALRLDPQTKFIGFVGRISEDKGVSIILKAFSKIKTRLPGYHIVIVGQDTDDYLNMLKSTAHKLDIAEKVHFTGFKENIWPYYPAFECKILPSIDIKGVPFEGIPQSLLESMICRCPVIGSKSGGIKDIIKDGETGLLFETENPSDLADKIMTTLNDRSQTAKRVKAAYEKVKKDHTLDAMGRNIIRIYRLHQVKMARSPY